MCSIGKTAGIPGYAYREMYGTLDCTYTRLAGWRTTSSAANDDVSSARMYVRTYTEVVYVYHQHPGRRYTSVECDAVL